MLGRFFKLFIVLIVTCFLVLLLVRRSYDHFLTLFFTQFLPSPLLLRYTMALHVLLRFDFLPNIHDGIIYRGSGSGREGAGGGEQQVGVIIINGFVWVLCLIYYVLILTKKQNQFLTVFILSLIVFFSLCSVIWSHFWTQFLSIFTQSTDSTQ
jgi:hypothetical protein